MLEAWLQFQEQNPEMEVAWGLPRYTTLFYHALRPCACHILVHTSLRVALHPQLCPYEATQNKIEMAANSVRAICDGPFLYLFWPLPNPSGQ